jgi:hypothetical protein
MPERKKVVAIGDLHCGHRVGLTPPGYPGKANDKFTAIREELWDVYTGMIDKQKPIDVLLVNGDVIDGTSWRCSGTDSLTTDMNEQVEMAQKCLEYAEAKHTVMTYGTAYHTAPDGQDWDLVLSRMIKADKIGGEETVNINGLIINMKHTVGRSSIPHGRSTPISKDRLWNLLWSERDQCDKAHIIIRSHVHYFHAIIDPMYMAMTLPALMGLGSKFGTRIPSETVDFGIVWFDIGSKDDYDWGFDTCLGSTQRSKTLKL